MSTLLTVSVLHIPTSPFKHLNSFFLFIKNGHLYIFYILFYIYKFLLYL